MEFKKIFEKFNYLKKLLTEKKQAIVKQDLDSMGKIDEELIVLTNDLKLLDLEKMKNSFTIEERADLKKLGEEIKKIENNNEMLIKHSLNVINNTLSGILNITLKDKSSYNSSGKSYMNDENIRISSITEEA